MRAGLGNLVTERAGVAATRGALHGKDRSVNHRADLRQPRTQANNGQPRRGSAVLSRAGKKHEVPRGPAQRAGQVRNVRGNQASGIVNSGNVGRSRAAQRVAMDRVRSHQRHALNEVGSRAVVGRERRAGRVRNRRLGHFTVAGAESENRRNVMEHAHAGRSREADGLDPRALVGAGQRFRLIGNAHGSVQVNRGQLELEARRGRVVSRKSLRNAERRRHGKDIAQQLGAAELVAAQVRVARHALVDRGLLLGDTVLDSLISEVALENRLSCGEIQCHGNCSLERWVTEPEQRGAFLL